MKLRKIVVEREQFKTVCEKFEIAYTAHPEHGGWAYINKDRKVELFYHVKQMPKESVPGVTTDPVNYFL